LTAPLLDEDGRFLGACSLILALDRLLPGLVDGGRVAEAQRIWLLGSEGQVLAAHPARGSAGSTDLPAALLRAVAGEDLGHVETEAPGAPRVLAFDRVHPLEWTLVAEVSQEALYARR
jgi:hypothetical protein